MSFNIVSYNNEMLDEIVNIWNENVSENGFLSCFNKEKFNSQIILNKDFKKEGFKVLLINNKIIGYGLAIFNEDEASYIPFVVVRRAYQRKGYGTKILNELINYLKTNNKKYIRQLFFSPISLEWRVNNTNNHIHPNTPAVLYNSEYYFFLINNGFYINGDNQNAYYLNIENFKLNDKLLKIENDNLKDGYKIEIYNKEVHYGEEELFNDLNNIPWLNAFRHNVLNENYPMLVVVKENKILGWTGPIYTKENKRGYFSGIGISPKVRSKGLGALLFNKLIVELKNIGAIYMTLFTGENNSAKYIYEKAGFKIVNTFAILRKDI